MLDGGKRDTKETVRKLETRERDSGKREQELFRRMLKKLKMVPMQKSVYLYPYPCGDEVEFLRQYFNVGDAVLYLTVMRLENEELCRRYFGL